MLLSVTRPRPSGFRCVCMDKKRLLLTAVLPVLMSLCLPLWRCFCKEIAEAGRSCICSCSGETVPTLGVRKETRGDPTVLCLQNVLRPFLSGLGHRRCWFGLRLALCRHPPTSQSPEPGTAYVTGTAFPGRA